MSNTSLLNFVGHSVPADYAVAGLIHAGMFRHLEYTVLELCDLYGDKHADGLHDSHRECFGGALLGVCHEGVGLMSYYRFDSVGAAIDYVDAEAVAPADEVTGWCCVDCALVLANDDDSGMTEDRAATVRDAIERAGRYGGVDVDVDRVREFSSAWCSVCDTTDAGARYGVIFFGQAG